MWSALLCRATLTDFRSQSELCFRVTAMLNVRAGMVRGQFNIFGAVEEKCGSCELQAACRESSKLGWRAGGLSTGRAQEMQNRGCVRERFRGSVGGQSGYIFTTEGTAEHREEAGR